MELELELELELEWEREWGSEGVGELGGVEFLSHLSRLSCSSRSSR